MKCISQYVENARHAGPKAKKDVETILRKNYNAKCYVIHDFDKNNFLNKIRKKLDQIIYLLFYSRSEELTIIQYPISNRNIFIKNLKNKILIIHDINGLRNKNKEQLKKEIDLFNQFNVIIAHNDSMRKFLVDNGVRKEILSLEFFDYLCKTENTKKIKTINNPTLVFSGNMSKSPFINELEESKMNFKLNLYGIGKITLNNKNIRYFGSFKPDELPSNLVGDIGLVWDGKLSNVDENESFKNYTKYNNPHKFSCYLASGIPVIVWKKSAIANTVEKYNIGYTISNLYDINNLDFSNYSELKKNVEKISNKIKNGFFMEKAIKDALDIIKEEGAL